MSSVLALDLAVELSGSVQRALEVLAAVDVCEEVACLVRCHQERVMRLQVELWRSRLETASMHVDEEQDREDILKYDVKYNKQRFAAFGFILGVCGRS